MPLFEYLIVTVQAYSLTCTSHLRLESYLPSKLTDYHLITHLQCYHQ